MTEEKSKIFQLLSRGLRDGGLFLPSDKYSSQLNDDCLELFERDNVCLTLNNTKGSLCSTYPAHLIVPVEQKIPGECDVYVNGGHQDSDTMLELVKKGRFARTRGRFPVPVMLFRGKFICRSSTLARSPEMYTRIGFQYFMNSETPAEEQNGHQNGLSGKQSMNGIDLDSNHVNGVSNENEAAVVYTKSSSSHPMQRSMVMGESVSKKQKLLQTSMNGANQNTEWLVDKMRNADIDVLHSLRVNVICDLMVEKKKLKFGMHVTSSEKVDRLNRYSDFNLVGIPYPGCEFFADYSLNHYTGIGLKFDWTQQFVDAELLISDDFKKLCDVKWNEYEHWDLVTLTQNYLILLLNCLLSRSSSGMLLHCISGWDRTPLFVSLLRLSLWADGLIHQSLNAEEIVYLTLAYDWLLFSHQFADRIDKSEEIMHFCFDFLKYIVSEDFSLLPVLGKEGVGLFDPNREEVFSFEDDDKLIEQSSDSDLKHCLADCNGFAGNGKAHCLQLDDNLEASNGLSVNGVEIEKVFTSTCNASATSSSPINMDDVKNCLDNIMSQVEKEPNAAEQNDTFESSHCDMPDSNVSTLSGMKDEAPVLELEQQMLSMHEELQTIAVQSSVSTHPMQNEEISDAILPVSGANGLPIVPSPLSALSASIETAKDKINPTPYSLLSEQTQKNLSNSAHDLSHHLCKSEPISVPIGCQHSPAKDDSNRGTDSLGSSQSNSATMAEPGSSWQFISSLSSDSDVQHENCPRRSTPRFNIHTTACYNAAEEANLKSMLEKRKERLKMAQKVMIPAYCAVVQEQRQRQVQQGAFSTIMGQIVHFVKRS
ncbi:uncharacterized protein LOC143469024 [Clavelina lepadiformis]|uniref:uncharacterized protein LOC143469024 n=1 Tax=Clavelina lepadiformis TaxID=159417 RepID=UPI00404166BF